MPCSCNKPFVLSKVCFFYVLIVEWNSNRWHLLLFQMHVHVCKYFFRLHICVLLSMWINGDWRVAESGWCRVINQHNECRWALCRWSPHSQCHPVGSLFASPQCLCLDLDVFLRHLSVASMFHLWANFCMIFFYNRLLFH